MWFIAFVSAFSIAYSPVPKLALSTLQKHVVCRLVPPKVAEVKAKKIKGKKGPRGMTRETYMKEFGDELAKKGTPDQVAFLNSLVWGESRGNHLAVSFIPEHLDKKGKKVHAYWYCGPVQTINGSLAGCQKIQREPRYAANKALEILRVHDRWPGSRVCNWKQGPGHPDCVRIRSQAKAKIPTS